MVRKCSHCGNIGHNSRTCNNTSPKGPIIGGAAAGVRLFGVQLDIVSSSTSSTTNSSLIPIKKCFSLDCLSSSSPSSSLTTSSRVTISENHDKTTLSTGYLSDGHLGRGLNRKKGVPWTEEEHRTFLIGLEKLGKGDWRGISRNFVTTRTPTQVASHAQKYFLRQATVNKKKRRSSLFDMVDDHGSNNASADKSKTEVYIDFNIDSVGEEKNSKKSNDLEQECGDQSFHQNFVWAYECLNSQLSSTTKKPTTSFSSPNAGPELELTLSAPRTIGPISVT